MGCGGPPVLDLDCLVPLDSRRSRETAGLREPHGQIVAWMSDASGLLRKAIASGQAPLSKRSRRAWVAKLMTNVTADCDEGYLHAGAGSRTYNQPG